MDDHFEVVFHHGGKFINDGSLKYVGESNTLTCDPDRWSYFEILSILKEMGYVNVKEMWYSVGGGSVLEGRLELLSDDKGACHMMNIAILNGQVHLFVVHMVSEPQIVHLLEYGGNEAAADEEVDVEDVVEVGEDGGVAAAAVVGEDVGVGASAEVDGGVGIGAAPVVDVDVGIEGCAAVGEDGGNGAAEVGEVDGGIGVAAEVGEADGGITSAAEVGEDDGGTKVDGRAEVGVEGEANCAVEVGLDGAAEVDGGVEVGVEGVEVSEEESSEGSSESDEDFEVHSWNESEEELSAAEGDDGLFDVPVGGDDASEDELFEVRIKEGNVGGVRGLSSQKPTPKHADQRGFSDTEWESETLDSDTSDEDRDRYGSFSIFSQPKNMDDYNWEVGTYFTEKEHFTDAIRTYGVHSGRKLKIFRNDKRRICVKCLGAKGKCKWYAYCAFKAAQSTWQLRKIINNHTCSREFNVRLMTSKWLSGRLEKTLRENPGVK